jgi:threonine dehydrogenase-like Zn-dependent dehydrogenase
MRAAICCGPRDIRVGDRPDPVLASPTDAVVRVVLACVCGSDLWYYRGQTPYPPGAPIGHEFVEVHTVARGDLVIAPFNYCDGTCVHCRAGWTSSCSNGGVFGAKGVDGGQGEAVRVPFADGTLPVPAIQPRRCARCSHSPMSCARVTTRPQAPA